jgi:integrase
VESKVNGRTCRTNIGRTDLLPLHEARKKALATLSEMAEGKDPNARKRKDSGARITVQEAFDAFFEARSHLSPHTVDSYKRGLNSHLADWRKREMRSISRKMVMERHRRIGDKHGKPGANLTMRAFRSVYNFTAATQEEFPPNPVLILRQAGAWFKETRRRTLISASDLPKWWQAVMDEPDYARDYLLVTLLTGMRRREVARLRWENIDLAECVISVPQTKNGDPLDLPMSAFLYDLIIERRQATNGSPWVFPGIGTTKHLHEVKRFIDRVEERSGVRATSHDLRRTFSTIAESLDIPHYALKRLLNHRTDSDVTGGYIVHTPDRLREPVERVAQRILELANVSKELR